MKIRDGAMETFAEKIAANKGGEKHSAALPVILKGQPRLLS